MVQVRINSAKKAESVIQSDQRCCKLHFL